MKKKLLSLMLSLIMIVGLLPINTFAVETGADPYTEYTTINVTTQDDLREKITSASDKTKFVLADGEYTMPTELHSTQNNPKDFVFTGNKDAVINITGIVYASYVSFTFDGVTLKFPDTADYIGFAHIDNLIYKDCKITGQQTLYSQEVMFDGCTLENMAAYCIWTWAASNGQNNKITFTDCKFNTGGKAINVYNGATNSSYKTTVELTRCEFYSDGTLATNKAAVESGSDGGNTETSNRYEITFTDCSFNGFAENNSSSPLWGNKNDMDAAHLKIVIDDVSYVKVDTQEELEIAIRCADSSIPTNIELANGNYTMPDQLHSTNNPKNIVFTGSKDAIISVPKTVYATDLSFTFDGVTLEFPATVDYVGFAHISDLIYKDCTIKGKQTLYSPKVVFASCTLENVSDYSVWTWSASNGSNNNITFTDCTFNTGGKAVLVYGAYHTDVTLTGCTFNATQNLSKAAVETGNDYGATYTVTINNCSADENFVANKSTSNLWGNKNGMDHEDLVVNLDGVEVTAPYVDMSGIVLNDKIYDGQPLTDYDKAIVKTYRIEIKTDAGESIPFTYQWYKNDGTGNFVEMNPGEVPTAVGEYKLKATIQEGVNVSRLLNNERSGFTKSVKITNPTYTVTVSGITDPIDILNGCTLTVDPNGGTWAAPNDFNAESDGTYTLTVTGNVDLTEVADPVKDEHRFIGWDKTTDADGNINLTAQWEKVVFTVTFDPNGGYVSPASAQTAADGTLGSLPTPTRSGMYIFDGWYTAPNGGTRVTTSTVFYGDTTVYAHWDYIYIPPMPNYYTLTFDTNGGSTISSITRASGTVVDLTDYVPTREGYTFDGWFSDKACTDRITSVKLTKNTTVYADWEKDEVDIPIDPETPDVPDNLNGAEHFAYIVGYDDGKVHPEADITRAEVATIFFRLLNEEVRAQYLTRTNSFLDVSSDAWYNTAVSTMANMGILKGYEGYFRPEDPITRAEFAAIAARFADETGDKSVSFRDISGHWAEPEILKAASLGWVEGYNGSYRPNDSITRAEAMTIINRVLCRIPETADDLLPGMRVWSDNADTSKWYYLAVQEATNSHTFEYKDDTYESWTALTSEPDWSKYQ